MRNVGHIAGIIILDANKWEHFCELWEADLGCWQQGPIPFHGMQGHHVSSSFSSLCKKKTKNTPSPPKTKDPNLESLARYLDHSDVEEQFSADMHG